MQTLDWSIVFVFLISLVLVAMSTKKHTRSVADYLAANRSAGRYILSAADGMVALGAVSVISFFEIYYKAGFTAQWWQMGLAPVVMVVCLSGWVVYRFRRTRSLTLLQFIEQRYSKSFRIVMGMLSFVVFLITMGIMPGIGARFFVYCCGLPPECDILGLHCQTYIPVMLLLISISLFFTFIGGQIAVMVTDFLQGMVCNIAFLLVMVAIVVMIKWPTLIEGLAQAPADASMIDPFKTSQTKDYNFWFFMVMAFNFFFVYPMWQGVQAYNSAGKNPHETRMSRILAQIRGIVTYNAILLIPVAAFVVMKHPQYIDRAAKITASLATINSEYVQSQMTVPVAIRYIIPTGILGLFVAAMLAAMISTQDTLLHAWGSIFVQDIVLPFRKKPFGRNTHMWMLRFATLGVAAFVCTFSILYDQKQDIVMFWAIFGTFYYGAAAGAVVFGLYWKRGTTAAAWTALATSVTLAGICIILQKYPAIEDSIRANILPAFKLPNSQMISFWVTVASMLAYVTVSLLQWKPAFDMDKLLHRGKYALEDDTKIEPGLTWNKIKTLGITKDFTRGDKFIYLAVALNTVVGIVAFFAITIYALIYKPGDKFWSILWLIYTWQIIVIGTIVTIWFLIGGAYDLRDLFKTLATAKRNDLDDGMVAGHQNLSDEVAETGQTVESVMEKE